METIHTRIKKRREELGMSMKDLAEKVGVSAWQTVQQWEKDGGTAPKRSRLNAVADALKTTPAYLTSGEIGEKFQESLAALLGEIETNLKAESELRRGELSSEAVRIGHAYESLSSKGQRQTVITLLRAFNVWDGPDAEK